MSDNIDEEENPDEGESLNDVENPIDVKTPNEMENALKEIEEATRNMVAGVRGEDTDTKKRIESLENKISLIEDMVKNYKENKGEDLSLMENKIKEYVSVESMKSSREAAAKSHHGGNDSESPKIAGKNYMEMKSRMDVLQKYVDGKLGSIDRIIEDKAKRFAGSQKDIADVNRLNEFSRRLDSIRNDASRAVSEAMKNVPKRDEIKRDIEEKISGKLDEFSRRIEEFSRHDMGKLRNVSDAEKKIDENLKLFALNSDVEKVWKETETLKRYIDDKTRMADSLANSLHVWETRNLQLMEKEHDFDEKMRAFPELKMLEGRIRRLERTLLELEKHFVAAQIAEPIIME